MKTSSIILIASFAVGISILSAFVIQNPPKNSVGIDVFYPESQHIPDPICFVIDRAISVEKESAVTRDRCFPLEDLEDLGCDKQILDHLYKYSNLFDQEFDGNYIIATIGLPEGITWEKLQECVDVILEKRLPSHKDLNISQMRVENACTEKPWICYGTFDNGTEIRIACDFPLHGCMIPFDKNSTGVKNEN